MQTNIEVKKTSKFSLLLEPNYKLVEVFLNYFNVKVKLHIETIYFCHEITTVSEIVDMFGLAVDVPMCCTRQHSNH